MTRRTWSELLGSMRFAIGSLSILAVASVIGTLLRQREPYANYVNQFGPFWARQLRAAGVFEVYNAWWFLLVLAFLVASTSLCLIRNTPKMLREMRVWRERVREGSLRAFRHRGEMALAGEAAAAVPHAQATLQRLGYRVKLDVRPEGTMVAAKRGSLNRLGYVFAHAGIVIVCLGGLLDSELPLRALVAWLDKAPLAADAGFVREVPASAVLPASNPSFRANLFVSEGRSADAALLPWRDGSLVQDLPFRVDLKRFRIEYYNTGMPKLFASEVELIDKADGTRRTATIKVNEPLVQNGITIYQSSFDDGGSKLQLRAVPLDGTSRPVDVTVEVGGSTLLPGVAGGTMRATGAASPAGAAGAVGEAGGAPAGASVASADLPAQGAAAQPMRLEVTGFRAINVEDISRAGTEPPRDKPFGESVAAVLSPSGSRRGKNLQNVGPSVQYKLRDAAGQAREFNVYMHPVELDGASVFLAGVRDDSNETFRFLRIPADASGSIDEYLRLRGALADAPMREQAARRYASRAAPEDDGAAAARLAQAAGRGLDLYAEGGLQAVAAFIERNVPRDEQERAADALMKVLNGALWELWNVARQRAGLAPAPADEASARFLVLAQTALSDAFLFGAPVMMQLTDFNEIKASVLQVTRSPGKNVVYLGCLSLVLGVFAMFYVRERRVWCWIGRAADGSPHALYAMSATRQTLDLDREFEQLRAALATSLPHPHIDQGAPVPASSRGA